MKKSIILFSFLFIVTALNATETNKNLKQKEEELAKDVHIVREGGTLPEYLAGDVWQYINDNVRFPAESFPSCYNSCPSA